jgi:hypothetical protein
MSFLISSREGRLCLDGKRIPPRITRSSFGSDQFIDGDFSIPPTLENIQVISQAFLDLYVVPMGGKRLPRGFGYLAQDIEKKYSIPAKGQEEYFLFKPNRHLFRSRRNLTRGWCLLCCATLHRFFYKEFDLYRGNCSYDDNDHHWWLQNQNGDVIDLAEEQYRISRIYDLRRDGTKKNSFPAASYSARGRNLAWKLAEYVSGNAIDWNLVPKYLKGYKK